MYVYEKYRMIEMNDQMREIEKAIDKFKGKPKLSAKDFLSRCFSSVLLSLRPTQSPYRKSFPSWRGSPLRAKDLSRASLTGLRCYYPLFIGSLIYE